MNTGCIKLTKIMRNKESLLNFLGKGNLFGIHSSPDKKVKVQYSAYAFEDSKVLVFNSSEYDSILKENPKATMESSKQWFLNHENVLLRLSHLLLNDIYIDHVSSLYMLRKQQDNLLSTSKEIKLSIDDLNSIFCTKEVLDETYIRQFESMDVIKRCGEYFLLSDYDKIGKCLGILIIKKKSQEKIGKKRTSR